MQPGAVSCRACVSLFSASTRGPSNACLCRFEILLANGVLRALFYFRSPCIRSVKTKPEAVLPLSSPFLAEIGLMSSITIGCETAPAIIDKSNVWPA